LYGRSANCTEDTEPKSWIKQAFFKVISIVDLQTTKMEMCDVTVITIQNLVPYSGWAYSN